VRITRLTPRQRQVLQLAAGGANNTEIATALGIDLDTAKNHLSDVATRYGLQNGRTALVIEGILCGDVDELLAYREVEARRRCADE
jgi:DNA-binding NarL/FixJ family response regulator